MDENNRKIPLNQRLCRSYFKSLCRAGNRCPFSHAQENTMRSRICYFYSKGNCRYGNRCKYVHLGVPFERRNKLRTLVEQSQENKVWSLNEDKPNMLFSKPNMLLSKPKRPQDETNTHGEIMSKLNLLRVVISNPNSITESPKSIISEADDGRLLFEKVSTVNLNYNTNEMSVTDTNFEMKRYVKALPISKSAKTRKRMKTSHLQKSADKICGICLHLVLKKSNSKENGFGILENCTHVFCLSCIKKWRQRSSNEKYDSRKCPSCHLPSRFYIPNRYWIGKREEKLAIIEKFKAKMSKIPCKYFKEGKGCKYGTFCYYLHTCDRTKSLPPCEGLANSSLWGNLKDTEVTSVNSKDKDVENDSNHMEESEVNGIEDVENDSNHMEESEVNSIEDNFFCDDKKEDGLYEP